jgi:capsular polysaccharide biosynthesis protein
MLIVGMALIISCIYAFMIAEPLYKAKAEIMVKNINTGVRAFDEVNEPKIIINEYMDILSDPDTIELAITKLQSESINIDKNAISKAITMSKGKDGISMTISAKYKDKAIVAPVINTMVKILNEQVSAYIREQIEQQIIINNEKIKVGEENYNRALVAYKEYMAKPESMYKLQSQIDINESLLVQLKASLLTGHIGQGKNRQQLEHDISVIEEGLNALYDKLLDESYLDRSLNSELNSILSINEIYNEENVKFKQAEIYYVDQSNIEVLAYAIDPEYPFSPRRKEIIIISLLAGACIGVLAVFTMEYLRRK